MSDDERATPCWYIRGVWHDADGKPVKNSDDQKEFINSIIRLETENTSQLKTILDFQVI